METPTPRRRRRTTTRAATPAANATAATPAANATAANAAPAVEIPSDPPPITIAPDPVAKVEAPKMTSREAAAARAAEILGHGTTMDEGSDKFEFDRRIIPDGWDYQWKRLTTLGQEDPAYQVQLARNGWEPVPVSRHPDMMPSDWKHQTITREGQILMMRPLEITDRFRMMEKRKALDQVRVKEAQLNSAPNGTFERGTHPGAPVKVNKGYEAIPIPKD
jgi:hypothetical protein